MVHAAGGPRVAPVAPASGPRVATATLLFSVFMASLPLVALGNYRERQCLGYVGR